MIEINDRKYKQGRSARERLLDSCIPEPNSGCWLWIGTEIKDGYGQMAVGGKNFRAHRLAFELFIGPIPPEQLVLHKCDVPACVNPEHLFLGTNKDNMDDCKLKGRRPHGESHWASKLTNADAVKIFNDSRPHLQIAHEFNISRSMVCQIKKGRAWSKATAQEGAE